MKNPVWLGVIASAIFIALACSLPNPNLPEGIQPLIDNLGFELEEELVDEFIFLTPRATHTPTFTPTLTPTVTASFTPTPTFTGTAIVSQLPGGPTFTVTPSATTEVSRPEQPTRRPTPPPEDEFNPEEDDPILPGPGGTPPPTVAPPTSIPPPPTVPPTVPPDDGGDDEEQGDPESPNVTLTVNTADDTDDGVCSVLHCSLREAIILSNAIAGTQIVVIEFDIPGSGPYVIQPGSPLPNITAAVSIDATTQIGADCSAWPPILTVILNGSSAGANVNGLYLAASNISIRGFVVAGFSGNGILIDGNGNNQLGCNFIGTDASGTGVAPNSNAGVFIANGSVNNTVGGIGPTSWNLISGNGTQGVYLTGSGVTGNQVLGNYIGVNVNGTAALGNSLAGVRIDGGAAGNVIGVAGAQNIISGNGTQGVYLTGSGVTGNQVLGNYIGVNINGTIALNNAQAGVRIDGGAAGNAIGAAGAQNIISGNGTQGVYLTGNGVTGNQVLGNYIGVNVNGTAALGNILAGVRIDGGAAGNVIGVAGAQNIISGNGTQGVYLTGNGVTGNQVLGNYIGVNVNGTAALNNAQAGVRIDDQAAGNAIGAAGAQNIISGNGTQGVYMTGIGVTGNQVLGNYIGVNVNGTAALGNTLAGVRIDNQAVGNTIGATGAQNIISGNGTQGVYLTGIGVIGNQVARNFIGTDVNGTAALANAQSGILVDNGAANNVIGSAIDGNIISGNGLHGVHLNGSGVTGNTVLGNYIGTDVNGTADMGNTQHGILIQDASNTIVGGTTGVTVGGVCTGACNLISGNGADGLQLSGSLVVDTIHGNYIGTDVNGTAGLGNSGRGVTFVGVSNSRLGSDTPAARNVISSNGQQGVVLTSGATNNELLGNYVGADVTGLANLGNNDNGVLIQNGAANNFIGRATVGSGNLIAYNNNVGFRNEGSNSTLAFSLVSSNTTAIEGGGVRNTNTLTITTSIIQGNTAALDGGGIWNRGIISLTTSTIGQNSAAMNGGGIYNNNGGTVRLDTGATVASNQAQGDGGGIYNTGVGTSLTILSSSILSNTTPSIGGDGGGLFNNGMATATIFDSTIRANTVISDGGGILVDSGNVVLSNTTVISNVATTNGGGITNQGGGVIGLTLTTVAGNVASQVGGGFYNLGAASRLSVISSTIRQNTATNGNGGGVHNSDGFVTIEASTVNSNQAPAGRGGGLSNGLATGTPTMLITNTTISTNTAGTHGGGVYNEIGAVPGVLLLAHSTVSSNATVSTLNGGGIHAEAGNMDVTHTIVANSLAGGDCTIGAGTITSAGYNLVEDASCAGSFVGVGDIAGDPLLGLLQNNGGNTETHALPVGSPAIDAGNPAIVAPPTTDQRGNARIQGVQIDIGAFEAP